MRGYVKILYMALCLVFLGQQATAEPVHLAIRYLPGHADRENKGITIDLLRAIYKSCDQDINFRLYPMNRYLQVFEEDKSIDAIGSLMPYQAIQGSYRSVGFVILPAGAVTLKNRQKTIATLNDLSGLRIFSFPKATEYLPQLGEKIPQFASYEETADPSKYVRLLALGRYDAYITDGLVYAAVYKKLIYSTAPPKGVGQWPKMTFNPLFKVDKEVLAFRDETKRDEFNRCYKAADESGMLYKTAIKNISQYKDLLHNSYQINIYSKGRQLK